MNDRRTGAHGLPVFLANELKAVKAEGSVAIVLLIVAGKIAIGTTADPNRYVRNVASAAKAETQALHITWAPDATLARRIRSAVELTLESRKLPGDRFDVPGHLAIAAVDVAARRIGVRLRTTEQLLSSHAVRELRKAAGYYGNKSEEQLQHATQRREDRLLSTIGKPVDTDRHL